MKNLVVATALMMANNGWAYAQTTSDMTPIPPICWLAGLEFSPGATARASDTVMECGADGRWTISDRDAAGCITEGKHSSTNALVSVSHNKTSSIECQGDGTWKIVPIEN